MAISSHNLNNKTQKMNESQHTFFSPRLLNIIEEYRTIDSSVTHLQKVGEEKELSKLIDKQNMLIFINNEVNLRKYFSDYDIDVIKLLNHVVRGEKDEAEQLIKKNPMLLLERGIVTDYSGRNIKGSALQIALCAEDVNINHKEEGMAEMIMHYLKTLKSGEQEIKDQINEQFPVGWEIKEAEKERQDLQALNTILKVIKDAQSNSFDALKIECHKDLEIFRAHFIVKNTIETGKCFSVKVLWEALKRYDSSANFKSFGGLNSAKNKMFLDMVIGTIQCFVPASLAQAFCQGMYRIVKDYPLYPLNEKLIRSLKFRRDDQYSYFPLGLTPALRLGYEYSARLTEKNIRTSDGSGSSAVIFEMFCNHKGITFKNIINDNKQNDINLVNDKAPRCVVM